MRTDTLRAMKNQIATVRNFANGPNSTGLISFHFSVTVIIKFICEMQASLQCDCLVHNKNFSASSL
jgi:hypothetical protein